MRTTIRRRVLVNLRADPDTVAAVLPDGLRPLLVDGSAVAGTCLVRLERLGWRSESAAHRFAVLDGDRPAVYIARRDTDSWLATAVGGRAFPGVHHYADVTVEDRDGGWRFALRGQVEVDVAVTPTEATGSLFADAAAATAFFRSAPVGLSPARDGRSLQAVELDADFAVEPLRVDAFRSTWFDDRFPPGSLEVDGAYVMRDVPARWLRR